MTERNYGLAGSDIYHGTMEPAGSESADGGCRQHRAIESIGCFRVRVYILKECRGSAKEVYIG
jgi:hypothetical protein